MHIRQCGLLAIPLFLAACGGGNSVTPSFSVSTSSAVNGRFLDTQFAPAAAGLGCSGDNISPQVSWQNAPAGTRSFVVSMRDRDAPTGSGFWHWVVADIPATVHHLAAGANPPVGALAMGNDGGSTGYGGICPPLNQTHRYDITVHALKVPSVAAMLPPDASAALVGLIVNANSLGDATLTVLGGTGPLGGGAPEATPAGFTVTSRSLVDSQFANAQFAPAAAGLGCTGDNMSPELSWQGAPAGTLSYEVRLFDNDAPTGSGFWHWVVADLPAGVNTLQAGLGNTANLPAGTLAVKNDSGTTGYSGICPPPGQLHNYSITVHALRVRSLAPMLPPNASPALVGLIINSASLGKTTLTVRGGRQV